MTLRNSLRALLHKQDLRGREHDLEVFEEAGLGDIHQIHQELVVGRRIVLAIDLGIAGESALGLEAEVPLRKFFFVLGGNLGALGARAYDGHVAFQDVQELREFIEADSTDEATDGGDAGIVLARGESRHAVFFGIHAHAAEFVDREYFPVFGKAVLLIKSGTAVSLDEEPDDEHGDGEDDEGCEGENDIEGTLEEEVLGRWRITTDAEDGQVEEVDLVSAAHDDVADARQDEGVYAVGDAVFHDDISLMAVNATAEDRLGIRETLIQISEALFGGEGADDFEVDVHAVALDEGIHFSPFAQDDDSLLRRKLSEIPVVCKNAPADDEGKLDEEGETKRNGIDEVTVKEDSDDVHHGIGKEDCQCLAVNKV